MKNKILLLSIVFLITSPIFSQQLSKEFKVVSRDDLDFKYEKEPDAEAVVLFDYGNSSFVDTPTGYDIKFVRTRRIKIMSRAGISYSKISIPFYQDGYGKTERVTSIEAYTYNSENGLFTRKELNSSTIYEERNGNNWKSKVFVFPNVKPGSIIEYRYTLETPFHFNLPDWKFQDRIPTLLSKYTLRLIPFYEYTYIAQGITKFDHFEKKLDNTKRTFGTVIKRSGSNIGGGHEFQDVIITYQMNDVPAFRDESYITSLEDYLMKLDFQLSKYNKPYGGTEEIMSTWPKMITSLEKNNDFGKYLKKSAALAKKIVVSEFDFNDKSNIEKSRLIVDYVKSSYDWNGGYGKYTSKSPKDFVIQKNGNDAEINLFLIALLRAAGLTAHPVILSTRNHGKIPLDYPFSHFFNYVVVLVGEPSEAFLTDGTENTIAFNRIPPRCINDKGLVVEEGKVTWVDLYNNIESLNKRTISLSIDPEKLTAKTSVTSQSTEIEAFKERSVFGNDTSKIKKFLLSNGFSGIDRIRTFGYENSARAYTMSYVGETNIERLGDKLIVSPLLSFPMVKNNLTQDKRSYPVDFIYSRTEDFTSRVEVPEGYKIVSVPKGFQVEDDLVKIEFKCTDKDKIIELTGFYRLKKSIYRPNEYSIIKKHFDDIVEKFNEQIVFDRL